MAVGGGRPVTIGSGVPVTPKGREGTPEVYVYQPEGGSIESEEQVQKSQDQFLQPDVSGVGVGGLAVEDGSVYSTNQYLVTTNVSQPTDMTNTPSTTQQVPAAPGSDQDIAAATNEIKRLSPTGVFGQSNRVYQVHPPGPSEQEPRQRADHEARPIPE